ncbi:Pimeloyl-ACP methyl ester carboxylesterase [Friedmanniella luteola]|uniref:Pimeloyl-ACP methyl ester carboxylesterase n=1 Tax=Friedmanniella luteola TaxID=546871 RepID=A0A1H2A4Z8_9ACTN|nr:alpha/beta hydrolase [Friedmanniella luteola]SDT40947.1 Pimeloyl-ACP methyl ester carboxylesterase [Friedmanniella luteola]
MSAAPDPLVLLPGMGCTAALWSALDLPDAPLTAVLEEPALDAEVDRLLDRLPERFALAGLSLGAVVAMALVRRAPQRVTRLALLSTNPHAPTAAQRQGWDDQRARLAAGSPRALQEGLLPLLLSPGVLARRADVVATTLAMADDLGAATYDAQLRLQGTRVDERPGLVRVRCPALVLAARDDRLCGLERHAEIARLVPRVTLAVVENSGHLSPLEQPAVVSAHLRRWLATPAP